MYPLVKGNMLIHKTEITCGIYGNGEPIILLHGTPSPLIWCSIVPQLVDANAKFMF